MEKDGLMEKKETGEGREPVAGQIDGLELLHLAFGTAVCMH